MKLRHYGFFLLIALWMLLATEYNLMTNDVSFGGALGISIASFIGPVIVYFGIFYLYDKLEDRKMNKNIRSAI